jgi:two-component system response regulator HydG
MNARTSFGDGVIDLMTTYDYPGNVRELENMVEQAVALSSGGIVTNDDVLPQAPKRPTRAMGKTLADIVDDAEREAVESALRSSDGNRERAAEALNISPTTLWRKMTRLGITYDTKG